MFAVRRIVGPVRQAYRGSSRIVVRDFNNRRHTGVISTPATTPVGHITKVIHCSAMMFCWLAPIAYFFAMLETYQGGPPPSEEEEA